MAGAALILGAVGTAGAQSPPDMSLEELMRTPIVTASRYAQLQREVAAAVHVVTREEIQSFGWTTIAEALASLPGIHFTYDRQFMRVGARGFGLPGDLNTRLLVMVDGVRWNEPTFDSAPLGREMPIDLALVERIEFIPGPGSAVYGQNAMFGVVNLITRTGAGIDGTEVGAALQPRERGREGRLSFGKLLDNGIDLTLSATEVRSRGLDLAMEFPHAGPNGRTVTGVVAGLDGARQSQSFLRASWGGWTLQAAHGQTHKDDPTGFYLSDPFATGLDYEFSAWYAHLTYAGVVGRDMDVLGRVFLGRFNLDQHGQYGGVRAVTRAASRWVGGELRIVNRSVGDHTLMAGLDFQDNVRTDQSFETGAGYGISIPEASRRFGLYAQDEWRLAPALAATLGMRLDDSRTEPRRASPRAALIWTPGTDTTVKAMYGRAEREPNVFESHYTGGAQLANPDLRGETIDTVELHVDQRASGSLQLGGSLYRWRLADPIVQVIEPATGLNQFQAGPAARGSGIEFSAIQTWAWGGRLRTALTWQDLDWVGERTANSPRFLARALFSGPLGLPRMRFGYELRYDGPRQTVLGGHTGGHAVSNLTFSAHFPMHGVRAGVTFGNLLNKRYAYPASTANWQESLAQDGASVRGWIAWTF